MPIRSVLAIAAHPDDIEFVMAGTLLQLSQRGWQVHYFNIANGSVHEMIAAVDLAGAIGAMNEPEARLAISLGARVKRMLRALLR
ncbi:MAG: PIG-L family deacetylase [Aureliella sp.]